MMFRSDLELGANLRNYKYGQRQILLAACAKMLDNMVAAKNGRPITLTDAFEGYMNTPGMPTESFFQLHLEGQSLEVLIMRHELEHAFALKDLPRIEKLLEDICKAMGEDTTSANEQYIFSRQAMLRILKKEPKFATKLLLQQARAKTIELRFKFNEKTLRLPKERNNLNYWKAPRILNPLVLEEPEIMHAMATSGEFTDEISTEILKAAVANLSMLPIGDREREDHLLPMLLELANYAMRAADYEAALRACGEGIHVSNVYHQGKNVADLLCIQAEASFHYGDRPYETDPHRERLLVHYPEGNQKVMPPDPKIALQQAYFSYVLLQDPVGADNAIAIASKLGVSLETHGIVCPDPPTSEYQPIVLPHGHKDTIGGLLRVLVKKSGYKLSHICRGICTLPMLRAIMKNEIQGNPLHLEAIFQRLGWDLSVFGYTVYSPVDFRNKVIQDEVRRMVASGQYDDWAIAKELIRLKKDEDFQGRMNRQFIATQRYSLDYRSGKLLDADVADRIVSAIKDTSFDFDENAIETLALMKAEMNVVVQLIIHYENNDKAQAAIEMCKALLSQLEGRDDMDPLKISMYPLITSHYTQALYREKRYEEELEAIESSESISVNQGQLVMLGVNAYTKAWAYMRLGDVERSKVYARLAHCITGLFGKYGLQGHHESMKNLARDHLKITYGTFPV